ncbi:hypothetical protein IAT38_000629 [Cryptococcus sp. DSM 104549]
MAEGTQGNPAELDSTEISNASTAPSKPKLSVTTSYTETCNRPSCDNYKPGASTDCSVRCRGSALASAWQWKDDSKYGN